MGKVCAVSNCPSGHKADRDERRRSGMRQISMFAVPKTADSLSKWSKSLRRNMTAKDVICELHFSPDSVLKEYVSPMPDGTIHRIPRGNYALVKDAVPMNMENQETVEAVLGTQPEETMEVVDSSAEQQDGEKGPETVETQVEMNTNDFSSINVVEHAGLEPEDELTRSTTEFSIDDIITHFKQRPFRQAWSWMEKMQNDRCIILAQIEPSTFMTRLVLKINSDLSVTARTSDGKVIVELHEFVATVQQIEAILDRIQSELIVCSGTGFDTYSRADDYVTSE